MINERMPKQQMPPQGGQGGAMPGKEDQGQQNKASSEDQNQYDMFMVNGISLIHDPKTSDALIKRIAQAADPVDAIARVVLDVVRRIEMSAQENQIELSPTTLVHGANDLMGEVITLAEAAGMQPLSDEQKHQSFSLAVALYLDEAVKSGKITPEQLQQLGKEASGTPQGQKIAQQMGVGGAAPQPSPAQPQPSVPQKQGGLLQDGGM